MTLEAPMATRKSTEEESFARYRDFIRSLKLNSIWLSQTYLELRALPEDIVDMNCSIDMKPVEVSYEQVDSKRAIVSTHHELRANSQDDEEIVSIQTRYKVEYTTDIPFDDELMSLFAQAVLPSHVFPYLREYVQNSFVRMGLPPLTLPMWKSPFITQESESSAKPKASRTRKKTATRKKTSSSRKSAPRSRSRKKT